jgi:DNA-binding CsgD family transcriptional regulator
MTGSVTYEPAITRRLIEEFAATPPAAPAPPGLDELTPRELEVFRLVAQGKSSAEIAAELIIGETTVKTHMTRTMMKLGVRDRVQAVVPAYEQGVVTRSARSRGSRHGDPVARGGDRAAGELRPVRLGLRCAGGVRGSWSGVGDSGR